MTASCGSEPQEDGDQVTVHRRSPQSFKAAQLYTLWLRIRSRR